MPLNELNPDKCCKICGGEWDEENNCFKVRCGNPIPAYTYSGKVCRFAKDKTDCLNPIVNDTSSEWETMNSLNPKTEKVLKDIGIDQKDINYLKLPGNERY